ncbi:MAG: crossover junction endodeoxyribonuclease RuvC [Gemmatimonadaceae bacterium]
MIVLGIDPGTAVTGYGVIDGERMSAPRLIECGIIRTRPRDTLACRLQEIHSGIAELIERHRPDALAIEDIFYARNVRTTIVLGHARGVVLLAAANAQLIIAEYPPAEIKKAVVGTGAATKEQVQFMVARILRLKTPPQPADASDGVAAALAYVMAARLPKLSSLAATSVAR